MKRLTVALLLSAVGAFPVCAQSYIQQVGPASSDNTLTFTPSPIIGGSGSMCSSGCGTIQLNLNNADTWTATPSFGAGLQITGPTGPADNYDWLRIIATSSPMITGGNSIIDVVGVVSPAGTAQTNISGLTVNYKMSGCSGCTTTNYLGINIVPIIDPSFSGSVIPLVDQLNVSGVSNIGMIPIVSSALLGGPTGGWGGQGGTTYSTGGGAQAQGIAIYSDDDVPGPSGILTYTGGFFSLGTMAATASAATYNTAALQLAGNCNTGTTDNGYCYALYGTSTADSILSGPLALPVGSASMPSLVGTISTGCAGGLLTCPGDSGLYWTSSGTQLNNSISGTQSWNDNTANFTKFASGSPSIFVAARTDLVSSGGVGKVSFNGVNSNGVGNYTNYAYVQGNVTANTAGSEVGQVILAAQGGQGNSGSDSTMFVCTGTSSPPANCAIESNVQLQLLGSTSGRISLAVGATAGTHTITFPSVTDTVATIGTAQTFSVAQTFSSSLINTGITSDSGHTDRTVCEDTTSSQFYSGSGTGGICAGTSTRDAKNDLGAIEADWSLLDDLNLDRQWTYKKAYGDPNNIHFGPYAEDVAKVLPKIVGHDGRGKVINYDWPSLLFALQVRDEQRFAEQAKQIAALQKQVATLIKATQ